MAQDKYISIVIDGTEADIDPEGQIPTISFILEDDQNWEQKQASESFDIELPGTLINQQIHNSLNNPSVVDNTPATIHEGYKSARYLANGTEVLIGKYIAFSVKTINRQIESFTGKIYGNNGDWVIDLKELTLYDFIQPRTHIFDFPAIIDSWNNDGRNEAADYIYAPARYLKPFGDYPVVVNPGDPTQPADDNVILNDLKPAFFIYWFLYRGFKSVGYQIKSTFMDTDFFRRATMPWTWGGFDFLDDTRWEPLKFLAKSDLLRISGSYDGFPNLNVVDNVPGAYDNSNTYDWYGPTASLPNSMVWHYPTTAALNLGQLQANFSVQLNLDYKLQDSSNCTVQVWWYKNGAFVSYREVMHHSSGVIDTNQGVEFLEEFHDFTVVPGDWIACRVNVHLFKSSIGFARLNTTVEQFSLNYMKLTQGSTINFQNYPKFKNYKWLDLLRGLIDTFDLQVGTDPVRKEVIIEPSHSYEIDGTKYPGYYNRQLLDWSQKVDYSKESVLELYSDYERELTIKFKDDTSDGGLKIVQDRNQVVIGLSKYVLPERFKTDKKGIENRFFSPTMHYEHDLFQSITGISPQLIAIIPENISNTSAGASENIYLPKLAWYKGNVSGVGGWKFNGITYNTLPFMFAVNYKAGGETDPVFSYSDQKIGSHIALGLLKKFYLQRMAIFRHGRRYNPINIMLNNNDITNFYHRESLIIDDIEYLLTQIQNYNPVVKDSTQVMMWMYVPVTQKDNDNTYPSIASIQDGSSPINTFDVKYWSHLLLNSDIPK